PGKPLILSDPVAPEALRRRFPGLGRLPATVQEVATARRLWDEVHVLGGADARKPAVLDGLRQAPAIYIAAHLVRSPDLPFSPFIPLAPDSSAPALHEDYLEMADVRALDLSGCELAVISTCSSAAPYVAGGRMGPSFGDAFVDAGAGCVLQAAWDVDDARTAPLLERFLWELQRGDRDPVRALGAARRAAFRGELGTLARRDWAAWSASIALPWSGPAAVPATLALRSGR